MSKHGGSPSSGLVLPAGLENLKPDVPDGMVLVPQEVIDSRKQAAERQERALQLERRRIGLEVLKQLAPYAGKDDITEQDVTIALKYADELIKQTGGGI